MRGAFVAMALVLGPTGCSDAGGERDGEGHGEGLALDAGGPDAARDAAPDAADVAPDPIGCNGHAALCDRRLDEVSFAVTHNSFSATEAGFFGPNQHHAVPTQLADGIRGLMLDVYEDGGELALCHGLCGAGRQPFAEALGELRTFLEAHPREVVVLLFESYVGARALAAAFDDAALGSWLYAAAPGDPWPTLGELVATGRRVVAFTGREGGTEPGLLNTGDWVFANHWHAETADDFDCVTGGAPPAGHGLFLLNHFLTRPLALPSLAEEVNHNPPFLARARRCEAEVGHLPNLVAVDFYDIGDVLEVVATLNGLTGDD